MVKVKRSFLYGHKSLKSVKRSFSSSCLLTLNVWVSSRLPQSSSCQLWSSSFSFLSALCSAGAHCINLHSVALVQVRTRVETLPKVIMWCNWKEIYRYNTNIDISPVIVGVIPLFTPSVTAIDIGGVITRDTGDFIAFSGFRRNMSILFNSLGCWFGVIDYNIQLLVQHCATVGKC